MPASDAFNLAAIWRQRRVVTTTPARHCALVYAKNRRQPKTLAAFALEPVVQKFRCGFVFHEPTISRNKVRSIVIFMLQARKIGVG